MGQLDENQVSFWSGKSRADVVQVMGRKQEDAVDCRRRHEAAREEWTGLPSPSFLILFSFFLPHI